MSAKAARYNPFRCEGTELPPGVLLMAKVLALLVLFQVHLLPDLFLPFVEALDGLAAPEVVRRGLQASALIGAAGILFNVRVRLSSLLLALTILGAFACSRLYFQNNRFFVASLLLLAGLSDRRGEPRLIRYQLVLVYLAAALHKLASAAWRSGAYFDAWDATQPAYLAVKEVFGALPLILGWSAILGELGIAAGLLHVRFDRWAMRAGVLFHSLLFLLTGSEFGMFFWAMLGAYRALIGAPPPDLEERPRLERLYWSPTACLLAVLATKLFTLPPGIAHPTFDPFVRVALAIVLVVFLGSRLRCLVNYFDETRLMK